MRFLFRLALTVSILLLGTIALGHWAERWLIYPLDPSHVTPSDAGLPRVREQIIEQGGETLIVWTAPPQHGQPVILYFHGNAGNLALRAGRFQRFLDRGYGLVAPAYRGSSGSTGRPSETALSADAAAIYRAIPELLVPDMRPSSATFENHPNVVVYGESLGTAVALSLVSSLAADPIKAAPIAALVLEAPFTSVAAMVEHHYPGLGDPARKLKNQWPNAARAAQVHQPLLVIHGSNDDVIPLRMGRQIFTAAPSARKQFLEVKSGGHTDLWRSDTLPKLWRFFDQFAVR